LFITQLSGKSENAVISSGRDDIYPVIFKYIKEENVFFPSGFGVARNLTDGAYYHAHNFFLEFILIFGLLGFSLFIVFFSVKVLAMRKWRKNVEDQIKFDFLLILSISFILRSLMGTHFIKDVIFLVCLGIILSVNIKKYHRLSEK